MLTTEDKLYKKIRNLNETIWEYRARITSIAPWLNNFNDDTGGPLSERLHALYILARFTYFSERQIKELLRSLYRDLYKYPIISSIRKDNNDTTDTIIINPLFEEELGKTRFLAMGRPSESGHLMLYPFRIVNDLPTGIFISLSDIFIKNFHNGEFFFSLRNPNITRYIFLDDFCGSGQQAVSYSKDVAWLIRRINPLIEVYYYVLVATENSIKHIKTYTDFNDVKCVYTLDNSYRVFGDNARYFVEGYPEIEKDFAQKMCLYYGNIIWPDHPLGWREGQLVVGFHHNTPDNTLPIIWYEGNKPLKWRSIFKRHIKH